MPHLPDRRQIFIPDLDFKTGDAITLGRVGAVSIIRTPSGKAKLDASVSIENDTRVELCGDGYSLWTVKIRLGGEYFFVFRADLNEVAAETPAAGQMRTAAN